MQINYALKEIDKVAKNLLSTFSDRKCFAFFATMGSGKTTLIRALCQQLHCIDEANSPTFPIINEYRTNDGSSIFHMDWYRLKGVEDAIETGVQDILEKKESYCFIEWSEIAPELLQKDVVKLTITSISETEREISVVF